MSEEMKIQSGDAYVVLNDERRLAKQREISDAISSPRFGSYIQETGLFLTKKDESLPVFGPVGEAEYVISRKQGAGGKESHAGSRIVLTRYNYGHRGTGLGGHGFTMCEAIDIVAGSLSCEKRLHNNQTSARANFITDGARIYLTERGDIQHYFAVGKRSEAVSLSSKMKSGIGIKADHTLIQGRERIMILAGLSLAEGGARTVSGNENPVPKIVLARTNSGDSQPAVLGTSLVDYLSKIKDEIQKVRNKLHELNKEFTEYKYAMATHTHQGFGLGAVTTIPSTEAVNEAVVSIPEFLMTTEETIRDTYNSVMADYAATGTKDGSLGGSIEKRILSSTVYIGK